MNFGATEPILAVVAKTTRVRFAARSRTSSRFNASAASTKEADRQATGARQGISRAEAQGGIKSSFNFFHQAHRNLAHERPPANKRINCCAVRGKEERGRDDKEEEEGPGGGEEEDDPCGGEEKEENPCCSEEEEDSLCGGEEEDPGGVKEEEEDLGGKEEDQDGSKEEPDCDD